MSLKTVLACLALPLLTLACSEPERQEAAANSDGLQYRVAAPADAVYDLKCRFKAVQIEGGGVANSLDLSGTGPQSGGFPGSDARCILTQTAGAGPVTLTIDKNGAQTATVNGPGATANLTVF